MPIFERSDIRKKKRIPPYIQIILAVAVICGIYMRSCWKKNQANVIQIKNIEITDYTPGNIDIRFNIINLNNVSLTKDLIIKVYDQDDFIFASKLTRVKIAPKSNKRYLKVLTKFNRPMTIETRLTHATVEIHTN